MKNIMKWFKKEPVSRGDVAEEALIIILAISAAMIVIGLVLSVWMPQGISAILAVFGAFVSFLSIVGLIIIWFIREGFR